MEINQISKFLFHYRKKLYTPKVTSGTGVKPEFIRMMIAECSALGYTMSKELMDIISKKDTKGAKLFFNETISLLKLVSGQNYSYQPLFKNFPNHLENNEYIIKKITEYVNKEKTLKDPYVFDCAHLISKENRAAKPETCPICSLVDEVNKEISKKEALDEYTPLTVIQYGDENELNEVFTNLLSGQMLFSPMDRDFVKDMFLSKESGIIDLLPKEIPKKENLVLVSAFLLKCTGISPEKFISFYRTSTDILRLATFLSSGSTSLSKNEKFKLKRSYRTMIMILLESIKNPKEDLIRYKKKWIKLAHCLHIGEYQNKFPKAFKELDELRNSKEKFITFSSKVNTLLSEKKIEEALSLLTNRPGEFLRKVDFLLRTQEPELVLNSFQKVLFNLSTINLLSLRKHFQGRNKKNPKRFFVIQKESQVKFLNEDTRELLSEEVISKVVSTLEEELLKRFSKEEKWDNVFLDEELKNILIPISNKDVNTSVLNMTKGSRIKLEDKNFLRMFCYWHETPESGENIDLDLSAVGFDENFAKMADVSYHNLNDHGATHSGDFRSAPNGASEFIDIPIDMWKEEGIRYIVMTLHSFSGQPFATYNTSAGIMQRSEPWKGDAFEANTVKNRFNLASDSRMSIPLVIDLESMEMVWADLSVIGSFIGGSTQNTSKNISNLIQVVLNLKDIKPSLYDLLELHCQARAKNILKEVNEEESEDIVLLNREFAQKMDEIISNYLK